MPGIGVAIGLPFGGYIDSIAPEVSAIEVGAVADDKIVLTYDENLDIGSVPAPGDFTLVGSALATISSVGVAGATVTLTLSSDIYDFEVIKISYTAGTNPIRDASLNNAANLVSQAVTNNGNASCTLNAETLDYSDLSLTSTQVDVHIAGLSTCTNCTIDISGTNDHRTAASNDDLNTLLANGNAISLNDIKGPELHTSLNAANDSATQAITAFSDHSATIDRATKVDSAIDFLSMIPQGATLNVSNCVNNDYTSFANGTPTGFDATSDGGGIHDANTADEIAIVAGKYFLIDFDLVLNSGTAPSVRLTSTSGGGTEATPFQVAVAGSNRMVGRSVYTGTGVCGFRNASTATNYEVTNLSVKELEVLGPDLVTDGDFGDTTLAAAKGVAGITKATPGVVTFDAAHGYADGDVIKFSGLTEMTELNDEYWILRSNAGDTFELQTTVGNSLDTSGYGNAETTGGNCAQDTTFTEWTAGVGWHPGVDGAGALNGLAHCDGSQEADSILHQVESFSDGETVLYKFTESNYSAGAIRIRFGSTYSNYINSDGTYEVLGINSNYDYTMFRASDDFTGSIGIVSVHKLTVQKEIAASTNYTGIHFVLPIDANDFAIPVPHVVENIVAQKFVGESNLTTGFTAANNAVLSSVDTPVNVGEFAIQVESNTTPTADADCDIDFTVESAAVYRLSVDWRHIGTGDDWEMEVEGVQAATRVVGNVTYVTKVYYFTAGDTTATVRFKEANISNNGGLVIDNIDMQKVTLS